MSILAIAWEPEIRGLLTVIIAVNGHDIVKLFTGQL